MSKKVFMAVLLMSTLSFSAFGEKISKPKMALTFNPGVLLLGQARVEFEYKFSDRASLVIPLSLRTTYHHVLASFLDANAPGWNPQGRYFNWSMMDAQIGGGAKIYFGGTALQNSWYVKPTVLVGYARIIDIGANNQVFHNFVLNPGVVVGYGWVWDSGFTLNLELGGRYAYFTNPIVGKPLNYGLIGFMGDGLINLGYAW